MELAERVVLVTGGASGIGEAVVRRAADAGASVVIVDVSEDAGRALEEELTTSGYAAASVVADVQNPGAAAAAVRLTTERFGRLDVLVNNAGIVRDSQLLKMDERQWDAVLGVNLTGVVTMTRAAIPTMRRAGGGRIVNIASRSLLGNFGQTNYAASKAGVVSFSKGLAIELGPANINVNAIAPGYIETPIMATVPDDVRERAVRAAPLRRAGRPDDVANVVVFLASDQASYVTGQCLFVCGGRSLNSALENWA